VTHNSCWNKALDFEYTSLRQKNSLQEGPLDNRNLNKVERETDLLTMVFQSYRKNTVQMEEGG
jgi:hypothetical protein